MEISARNYGEYGLGIIGSFMGIFLVVMLSDYIANHLPVCRYVLQLTGNAAIAIWIVHALFGDKIGGAVSMRLEPTGTIYMLICMVAQIMLAIIIKKLIAWFKGIAAGRATCAS